MTHHIFSGIGILATGAVAGALLFSAYKQIESQPAAPPSTQDTTTSFPSITQHAPELTKHVEALEEELNHYREWTFQLENQVIDLESRLSGLEEAVTTTGQHAVTESENEKAVKGPTEPSQTPSGILSVAALVENGLDPQLAAEIVKQKNLSDMQQLELRDQAIRDGTFGKQEYFKALRELNGTVPALRSEIGDDAYDRYLYTLGQSNRVIVTSVIPGSPAEQAGVQGGDLILAYDDKRLFNWSELRSATSEGELGEYISINIQRNSTRISLLMPRGPLGVRMGNKRVNPTAY
ncbi:MAG: PDZ domain-containing protein [Pseudomonadota bacterium]